jgi:hypothetical protein
MSVKKDLPIDIEQKINDAGYVFTLNYNLGDGKMLQIVGNFPRGAKAVDMNAELDKVRRVFKRQRLVELEIPTLSGALEDKAREADAYTMQLEEVIERNASKERMTSSERAIADNIRENIRKYQEEIIPLGKTRLAELMAQLAELEKE